MLPHHRRILLAVSALVAVGGSSTAQELYDESVFRTFELTFAQPDWWQQLHQNRASGTNLGATLRVDGRDYLGVGVRFKGNTQFNQIGGSAKKPFKIEVDWTNSGLDLHGFTSINLNNAFRDPTFCREVLTYHFARRYLPAPRANFVKLVINGDSWGVYVNVEQVDKKYMDRWFEDRDGNRYKGDGQDSAPVGGTALTWLGNAPGPYQLSYELKTPGNPNVWTDLIQVCDKLNNTPSSQFGTTLDPSFAIDRALWYLAVCNVFAALDTYIGAGHNFYLLVDDVHGRMSITPWDMGESFGAFGDTLPVDRVKRIEPDHNRSHPFRPLITRLLGEPAYRNRYLAHVRTLLDEVWDWNVVGPKATEFRNRIRGEVLADNKKLYSLDLFDRNFTQDVILPGSGRAGGSVPGLQSIVDVRRSFLLGHAMLQQMPPTVQNLTRTPSAPTSSDTVTVTARVVGARTATLFHRTVGRFRSISMQDDGNHGDGAAGDGVYGARIPPHNVGTRVSYYVGGVAQDGGARFLPRGAEHQADDYVVQRPIGTSVMVHEFLAINDGVNQDAAGEFDDWVELLNPRPVAVDVGGVYLSDDRLNPTRWQIPAGTTIPAGQTLLIWADNDPTQGPLHATFRLSGTGEDIVLTDRDGQTTLDLVTFGPQQSDVSQGRAPHGGGVWIKYLDATPDAPNRAPSCGALRYQALDPTLLPGTAALSGSMRTGATPTLALRGMGASTPVVTMLSVAPVHLPLGFDPAVLLIEPPVFLSGSAQTAPDGSASVPVPIPGDPGLDGLELYHQAWSLQGGSLRGSNALATRICR